MSHNNLVLLPKGLFSLALEALNISYNPTVALPKLDSFEKLCILCVGHCKLNEFPVCINNLVHLRILIANNNLIGHLPDTFGPLRIEKLDLSFNQIEFIPESFSNLVALRWLNLR